MLAIPKSMPSVCRSRPTVASSSGFGTAMGPTGQCNSPSRARRLAAGGVRLGLQLQLVMGALERFLRQPSSARIPTPAPSNGSPAGSGTAVAVVNVKMLLTP